MKSLVLAFIFFGVVIYGCFDVQPFKAVRRVLKRTPSKTGGTAPLRRTGPLPTQPYPEHQEYPARRRHY